MNGYTKPVSVPSAPQIKKATNGYDVVESAFNFNRMFDGLNPLDNDPVMPDFNPEVPAFPTHKTSSSHTKSVLNNLPNPL